MAAPATVPDYKLEDRICRLRKLSRDPGVGQILEEAMQLCGAGRQMEAVALVEKAEAMNSVSAQDARPTAVVSSSKPESALAPSSAEQPFAARLAADVAAGLTNV